MHRSHSAKLLLVAITVVTLSPFLNKAFHIDDPLFIWMAQHIVKHPLDPYGFEVNWAGHPQPAFEQIQNPPLASYYIAAVGSLVGWSEVALHAAFLIWAILAILGTFALAHRFLLKGGASATPLPPVSQELRPPKEAFLAALFTLFTPVFLVSATNVMCDVMLLALWLWSIELWVRGLERSSGLLMLSSALLIAAAALTKYFGLAAVPLLALYTVWRNWRDLPRLLMLVLPVAAVAGYDFWTKSKYGRGLFSDAFAFAHDASAAFSPAALGQFLIGLSFLGGSLVAPIFCWRRKPRFPFFATLLAGVAGGMACWLLVPLNSQWHLGDNAVPVLFEAAGFAGVGGVILAWIVVELVEDRSPKQILLVAWSLGTFAFATFLNWSITARTFLPIVPVVAILLVRRCRSAWLLVPAALVSLAVAVADLQFANSARAAALASERRFRDQHIAVWFQSHWGFQYYMQRWGAKPFDSRGTYVESGDVMVVPANNTAISAVPPDRVFPPEEQTFPVNPFITTMGLQTGASFYSSIRGAVPWAVDKIQPEKYYIARFR